MPNSEAPVRPRTKSSLESSSGNTPKRKFDQKYIQKYLSTKSNQSPQFTTKFRADFETKRNQTPRFSINLNHSPQRFPAYSPLKQQTPNRDLEILLLNVISNRRKTKGGDLLVELLKLEEVMAELKVSRTTLWRLRQAGVIKECRLGGLIWITRADLNRFIRNEVLAGRSI